MPISHRSEVPQGSHSFHFFSSLLEYKPVAAIVFNNELHWVTSWIFMNYIELCYNSFVNTSGHLWPSLASEFPPKMCPNAPGRPHVDEAWRSCGTVRGHQNHRNLWRRARTTNSLKGRRLTAVIARSVSKRPSAWLSCANFHILRPWSRKSRSVDLMERQWYYLCDTPKVSYWFTMCAIIRWMTW